MKAYLPLLVLLALVGCGEAQQSTASVATPAPAEKPAETAATVEVNDSPRMPDHFYSMHEDGVYGYERAVSENEQAQGQVANALVMVSFAGHKDGKYQIFFKDGSIFTAFECSNPCEFVKVMTFENRDYIRTERMKFVPQSIAGLALIDAFNGKLEPSAITKRNAPNKKYNIWFSKDGASLISI